MKVTIAQLNPKIADIKSNLEKFEKAFHQAALEKSDVIVASELYLTGYPPRDLLYEKWFKDLVTEGLGHLVELSKKSKEIALIVGLPWYENNLIYNSAVVIKNGQIIHVQHKSLLPTYDVFDEDRYFSVSQQNEVFEINGKKIGLSICEDAWSKADDLTEGNQYNYDPVEEQIYKGAEVLINISASPYQVGKQHQRFQVIQNYSKDHGIPFVYVNQIGGNDELIFDGHSMVINSDGNVIYQLKSFQEEVVSLNIFSQCDDYIPEKLDVEEKIYKAIVLGLKDYLYKCGFKKAVVGLSGGIDSAVVAAIAVEALGKENVFGITMPSQYSSEGSVNDSVVLAENLGIDIKEIAIKDIFDSYLSSVTPHFMGIPFNVAEENIQARIRGDILMAFSNKFGHIVLTTGNKSEMAVGYCTLYGDMSGGLSVLSDVPKTMVYQVAEYINREKEIIPYSTIKKAPSAELRPDQEDQDTLPPYDVLDRILELYIEQRFSKSDIISEGFDEETVEWVVKTIHRNEYKRNQAAPGLRVTSKAFGIGRRIPLAASKDN